MSSTIETADLLTTYDIPQCRGLGAGPSRVWIAITGTCALACASLLWASSAHSLSAIPPKAVAQPQFFAKVASALSIGKDLGTKPFALPQPKRPATPKRAIRTPEPEGGPLGQLSMGVGAFLSGFALTAMLKSLSKAESTKLWAGNGAAAAPEVTKYKLRYFDARGVAEVSRLLFSIAGVPCEDYRYKFTFGVPGDFSTISKPEFDSDKASGVLEPNMGRLPILEVNGVPIGQSKAIERFLARQFDFMGQTPVDAAHIDAICEHVRDIKDGYRKLMTIRDPAEKAVAMKRWYKDDLPMWCRSLERCLGDTWAVGSKFSLADLSVWALLEDSFADKEATLAAYRDCPQLRTISAKVTAMEGVQAWLQKRPPTIM